MSEMEEALSAGEFFNAAVCLCVLACVWEMCVCVCRCLFVVVAACMWDCMLFWLYCFVF